MVTLSRCDDSIVIISQVCRKEGGDINIQIKQLHQKYDEKLVLENIEFSVENVASVGIIGSSGCGKSTLLRLLAGIEDPFSGDIWINGVSPSKNKKELQEKISFVFQHHNLFPHLTIERNITLLLEKIKGIDKKTSFQRAEEVLEELFMVEHKDKLPSQVSGGQAQRASIARALSTNPEMIFLDEPTAALDPQLTYEVLQSVEKLKEKGIEFIFVTHEMKFLQKFADYFIYVQEGKIHEYGDISILENPKTEELRHFLKPHFM